MNYTIKSIGDVTDILSGYAFDSSHFDKGNGIKLIRIRDVVRGYSQTEYNGEYEEKYVIKRGDILIGMDGEFNVARWQSNDALLNQRVCKISISNQQLLDENYLYHFLPAQLKKIEDATPFVTVKHLSVKTINQIQIPLPPLAEQQRIAAILDKAAEIKTKREQAIAKLDELAQSAFLEMFGDPNSNPKQWDVKRLHEICHKISDIDHKMPKAVDKGYPFISAKDLVKYGKIDFTNVKFISKEDFDRLSRKIKPEFGDILYSRIGTIGRARLVEVQFDFLASYSCCTIKPKLELVLKEFLCDLLDSTAILKQAHKEVKGIAVPDLGMSEIRSFQIILPPKNLQQRYIDFKKTQKLQLENMLEDLMKVNSLISSLQHQAFTTGFNA